MSIDQKKLFESGINNERYRVLQILADLNNHGMTHGPHCAAWHGFYKQATELIDVQDVVQDGQGSRNGGRK